MPSRHITRSRVRRAEGRDGNGDRAGLVVGRARVSRRADGRSRGSRRVSPVVAAPAPTLVKPVTLEGRFVRLEPLTEAHAGALLAAAGGSRETYGLTLVPGRAAEAAAYIETALAEQRATRSLPFVTVDPA